jgi:hypothetical protein
MCNSVLWHLVTQRTFSDVSEATEWSHLPHSKNRWYETCSLLRHYSDSIGNFVPTFRSHLQGLRLFILEDGTDISSRNVGNELPLTTRCASIFYFAAEYWADRLSRNVGNELPPLAAQVSSTSRRNIGPIGCPETSVRNYHYSLCNNPEERRTLLLRGGSLKSRIAETRYIII